MKITPLLFALLLVSLTACSTLKPHSRRTPPVKADPPETIIVYYHTKAGQEAALQETLARAWAIYQKEHMVLAQPHVIVRDTEKSGQTRFTEIFTWVNHATPLHPSDAVKAVWSQLQALCDPGFDGNVVELLVPPLQGSNR